jgi:WD40 repeat protein
MSGLRKSSTMKHIAHNKQQTQDRLLYPTYHAGPTGELEKLIAKLSSQTPLIGWKLRRMAVKALAQDGSSEAIDALADTLIRSDDSRLRQRALKALVKIAAEGKPEAQDALCRLVVEHNHPLVREIVLTAQYAPHDPNQRVLFVASLVKTVIRSDDLQVCQSALEVLEKIAAEGKPEAQEALCRLVIEYDHPFAREIVLLAQYAPRDPYQRALLYVLTAQWDKYEQLDFDRHLLRIAYKAADKKLRKRIVRSVQQGGRGDLLASFVTREKQTDGITDKDWEAMSAVLSKNGEWAEIWQLAQAAPLSWSVRLLLRLKEAKWMPKQEIERAEFTTLVRLAEECSKEDADTMGWLVYCHETLEGHTDDIRCLAISPDGQVLASGSNDNTVRLWDLPDGLAFKTLREPARVIIPDLPYWAYRRKSALRTLKGHTQMVTCLAISPDGQVLASGSGDNTVRLWSLPGGMALRTLKGHTNYVSCLAISPDGQVLASGSGDNTVRLWNLPEGTTLKTLKGYTDDVKCLAISPDGRVLASGSGDKMIRLWSLPDGEALHALEGHTHSITCLAISPDGRLLVSGSDDHTVRLWSLPDGVVLKTLRGHTAGVGYISISPDGRVLASGSYDHTIRLWTLPDGIALKTLKGHANGVSCLAMSPDGQVLASGGFDRAVRLWVLGKVDLGRLIAEQTSLKELRLLQERLQEEEVADAERKWLEFILTLIRWQRRFDIEVGETPQEIPVGEFDIEIDT